jgi:hypothetical protein
VEVDQYHGPLHLNTRLSEEQPLAKAHCRALKLACVTGPFDTAIGNEASTSVVAQPLGQTGTAGRFEPAVREDRIARVLSSTMVSRRFKLSRSQKSAFTGTLETESES